jgi:hypothetical protein
MLETVSDAFAFPASCSLAASFGTATFIFGLLAGLSHRIGIPELVFSLTNTPAAITFCDVDVVEGDMSSFPVKSPGDEVARGGSDVGLAVVECGFALGSFGEIFSMVRDGDTGGALVTVGGAEPFTGFAADSHPPGGAVVDCVACEGAIFGSMGLLRFLGGYCSCG